MSSTSAEKGFHIVLPPRPDGFQQVMYDDTTTSTDVKGIFTDLAAAERPLGKCFVTFQAEGQDTFILISSDAAQVVTTSTGLMLANGSPRSFWVDPTRDLYVAHICASSTSKLKWYVSSPYYEGMGMLGA